MTTDNTTQLRRLALARLMYVLLASADDQEAVLSIAGAERDSDAAGGLSIEQRQRLAAVTEHGKLDALAAAAVLAEIIEDNHGTEKLASGAGNMDLLRTIRIIHDNASTADVDGERELRFKMKIIHSVLSPIINILTGAQTETRPAVDLRDVA